MQAAINPGTVQGTVRVPPSKSIMQRACAAALLHMGITTIHDPGASADDTAALQVIQQLGAEVSQGDRQITIASKGIDAIAKKFPGGIQINCGESGLTTRLFIPIAGLLSTPVTVTGTGSLVARPMELYKDILPQLGITITSANGRLPFTVTGPLRPGNITIDGSVSSQFLSGLLFAYCYAAHQPVTIQVQNLKSRAYIDLTIDVLKRFGNDVRHEDYKTFYIGSNKNANENIEITVESDWSSASCLMVAAAITGKLGFTGLQEDSLQADKQILAALHSAGALITMDNGLITVEKAALRAFEFDATDCPDLFPALSVLAACCKGTTSLYGIHRLMHKESNRIESISEMLEGLGVHFFIEDDCLGIEGRERFDSAYIHSFNDHRIVMAASVAALRAYGMVTIDGAEAVSKSYPDFFTALQQAGVTVSLKEEAHE